MTTRDHWAIMNCQAQLFIPLKKPLDCCVGFGSCAVAWLFKVSSYSQDAMNNALRFIFTSYSAGTTLAGKMKPRSANYTQQQHHDPILLAPSMHWIQKTHNIGCSKICFTEDQLLSSEFRLHTVVVQLQKKLKLMQTHHHV